MTEKIERRGVSVPSQYGADVFEHTRVAAVMDRDPAVLPASMPLATLAQMTSVHDPGLRGHQAHPIVDEQGELAGIVTRGDVIRAVEKAADNAVVLDCATTQLVLVTPENTLHEAILKLLRHDIGRLPVVAPDNSRKLVGYLSRSAILSARSRVYHEETQAPGWTLRGRRRGA